MNAVIGAKKTFHRLLSRQGCNGVTKSHWISVTFLSILVPGQARDLKGPSSHGLARFAQATQAMLSRSRENRQSGHLGDPGADSDARFDFRLRPHYLPLGLRGCSLAHCKYNDKNITKRQIAVPRNTLHLASKASKHYIYKNCRQWIKIIARSKHHEFISKIIALRSELWYCYNKY